MNYQLLLNCNKVHRAVPKDADHAWVAVLAMCGLAALILSERSILGGSSLGWQVINLESLENPLRETRLSHQDRSIPSTFDQHSQKSEIWRRRLQLPN
jgi:hypothetical protein